jgi:hypothetical protein
MSTEKDKTNIRSEIKSDGLKELLRRADEDAANKVEASHSGDELINLADNIHALTEDFSEDLASAAVIEGQIFDTTTSGSYEEGDIQVLEGLEAVRLRPSMLRQINRPRSSNTHVPDLGVDALMICLCWLVP